MISVGFTGTQAGMTTIQKLAVHSFLSGMRPEMAHHGDCIGPDKDFHDICDDLEIPVTLHPPTNKSKRAFCVAVEEMPAKEYLVRNHEIVDAAGCMIATPKEHEEQMRSGTWATIRYTKKRDVPLYIFFPDGTISTFYGQPPLF